MKSNLNLLLGLFLILGVGLALMYVLRRQHVPSDPKLNANLKSNSKINDLSVGRWRFLPEKNGPDFGYKTELLARIDQFWKGFREMSDRVSSDREANYQAIHDYVSKLHQIHPDLTGEITNHPDGTSLLAISCNAGSPNEKLVETVLERAGKIKGWEFSDTIEPIPSESLSDVCRAWTGRENFSCIATLTKNTFNTIDIELASPSFTGDDVALDIQDATSLQRSY